MEKILKTVTITTTELNHKKREHIAFSFLI